jgi:NAD(P)-dependent dehydrogenase (short-subunit alcohol dehydrogenase family)
MGGTSGIGRGAAIALAAAGRGWLRAADARKRKPRWVRWGARSGEGRANATKCVHPELPLVSKGTAHIFPARAKKDNAADRENRNAS